MEAYIPKGASELTKQQIRYLLQVRYSEHKRQTDKRERLGARQTDNQTDSEQERQTDRQTEQERQTDRQTEL